MNISKRTFNQLRADLHVRAKVITRRYEHIIKFLFVGSLNSAFDLTIFFILANSLSIHPVAANLFSTSLTMCISFFLNHHFVFHSRKNKRQTAYKFVATTLFNVWIVQSLIISMAIKSLEHNTLFALHPGVLNIAAKLCGIAVSLVLNFAMYRVIFQSRVIKEGLAS